MGSAIEVQNASATVFDDEKAIEYLKRQRSDGGEVECGDDLAMVVQECQPPFGFALVISTPEPLQISRNRGFGTTLIEETLRARGGDATLHYAAAGFSCELQLPLPQDWYMAQQRYPMQNHSPEWSIVPKTQRSPLEGRRIIIVEDEPLILMDMEQSLSEAGAEIAGTAGNLDAAKDLVSHTECDAALLDTNLSGERVEELAMTLTRRNIPFAFVTGYGRDALPEGFREGVLLNKPFSPEQLAATLEMLLRRGADVVAFRRDLKS